LYPSENHVFVNHVNSKNKIIGGIAKRQDKTGRSSGATPFIPFRFLLTVYPAGVFSPVRDDLSVVRMIYDA
jgi:hypothetical protein